MHEEKAQAGSIDDVDDALLERLEARAESAPRKLVRRFATATLRRRPHPQSAAADLDAVADRLTEAFEFFAARRRGEIAICVANHAMPMSGHPEPCTVVEVASEDRPFLLTTATEELRRLGHEVVHVLHPVIGVVRDDDGRLADLVSARGAKTREALLHLELDTRVPAEQHDELSRCLRSVLEDVAVVIHGESDMREEVERFAAQLRARATSGEAHEEALEAAALLDWLLHDNFLPLGWREYGLVEDDDGPVVEVRTQSGLGILADPASSRYAKPVPLSAADEAFQARHARDDLLTVARSNRYSTVHERVRMMNVWVKETDDEERVRGEVRLLGLFTERAHAQPKRATPVLRRKLARILELEDVVEDSHDERGFVTLFDAVPLEELFELPTTELHNTLVELVAAEEREDLHLVCHTNPLTRTLTALLSVPSDDYDAELRRGVEELLLERFGGASLDVDLSISERRQPLVRFAVHLAGSAVPEVDTAELESQVRSLTRTWIDELESTLVARNDDSEGRRLLYEFGARMPAVYRERTAVERAAADVEAFDELVASGAELKVLLHDDHEAEGSLTRLKVLKVGPTIELSAILPILESLGITVSEELPLRLTGDEPELHLHDYGVHSRGQPVELDHEAQLAEGVVAAWQGRLEIDSLNQLVLHAGLAERWIGLLRAYRRFRLQVGTVHTDDYQNEALVNHPKVTRALVDLFDARFNPDRPGADVDAARERVLEALEGVERLDDDRILRGFLALVDATLRTNLYRTGADRLALKFASPQVPDNPQPVPHREIFVYSPEVEGIHLRGGFVARGGIRWSERRDDFRTEGLGLMRSQMLKNALIVPTGAKGGFVLKRSPAASSELEAEVGRQFETFIRALLDVTDNVVGGEVQPPAGVRRADGDDFYLVVAADRGTSRLSNAANAIAAECGFWLGDAFASGGSDGYDHKQLGITARGVWLAVQRHFRELGIDTQRDPITVVGIGDMSGDVFGNGMLRSRTIRLVAAFDHRDIFLDPKPDPERAYAERRRLYDAELSWQHYDRDALGPGGGVWSRTEKSIPLADEIRELLPVEEPRLSPPELIRAILAAPVDLLFAGGIGTFVRASHESNEEILDRMNDELRIDASELRARIYAEGANLSITQPARIQYARRGGRINADFIDNAAGVDISDHEVNLKILLNRAVERGLLDADERTALLAEVTDSVVAACLHDVDEQTWVLSQEATSSPDAMDSYEGVMSYLEATGKLDRKLEALPSMEEMQERREAGAGLIRPELAVLLAIVKRDMSDELVASSLPDQPGLRSTLRAYYPRRLVERCGDLLDEHRLDRELIATVLTNDVVNHAGITFAYRLSHELGAERPAVVAAYWIAREVARADRYWECVGRLDRDADSSLALEVKLEVDRLLETLTREYLRSAELDAVDATIDRHREAFEAVARRLAEGGASRRKPRSERAELLVDAGLEPALAHELAAPAELAVAPDVASVADAVGRRPSGVAEAFLVLGQALSFERLHRLLDSVEPPDRWARWQLRGLVDDLRALHRVAVQRAFNEHPDRLEHDAVERFLDDRRDAIQRSTRLIGQAEEDPDASRLDAVSVAMRAVRNGLDRRI